MMYAQVIDDPARLVQFEQICETYSKQMFFTAKKILGDTHEAENAVQDALLGIARNMKTVSRIRKERDLYYYVQCAAKNAALNRLHKLQPHREAIMSEDVAAIPDDSFWEKLCNRLDCEALTEAIAALPDTYRQALYFHYVMELTVPETAKALEIKASAAKQRLVRGKKLLMQMLEERGGWDHVAE